MFIATDRLSFTDFELYIKRISKLLGEPVNKLCRLYDGTRDYQELKELFISKLNEIELARQQLTSEELAAKEKRAKEAEAYKRSAILNMKFSESLLTTLAKRRSERSEPVVLVVEDDDFSQQLVGNVLRKICRIDIAENGEQALKHYVNNPPDMVFLDINLPDIAGFEVLRKLQAIDPQAHIVMLSGNGDRDNVMRALKQGAKGFVGKPFSPKKLMKYLAKAPLLAGRVHVEHVS